MFLLRIVLLALSAAFVSTESSKSCSRSMVGQETNYPIFFPAQYLSQYSQYVSVVGNKCEKRGNTLMGTRVAVCGSGSKSLIFDGHSYVINTSGGTRKAKLSITQYCA